MNPLRSIQLWCVQRALGRSGRQSSASRWNNRSPRLLWLERLEDRALPSVSISISDVTVAEGDAQIRYIDDFVSANSGGLDNPHNIAFGPDGYLYVASGFGNQVLRYDSRTGAFKDAVLTDGSSGVVLNHPWALAFGPAPWPGSPGL